MLSNVPLPCNVQYYIKLYCNLRPPFFFNFFITQTPYKLTHESLKNNSQDLQNNNSNCVIFKVLQVISKVLVIILRAPCVTFKRPRGP